jgi:hypothetical protein
MKGNSVELKVSLSQRSEVLSHYPGEPLLIYTRIVQSREQGLRDIPNMTLEGFAAPDFSNHSDYYSCVKIT